MAPVRNIIFDYGGVLFGVDYHRTEKAFDELGFPGFGDFFSKKKQTRLFDELEKGGISADIFREGIREAGGKAWSDEIIDSCWNAMLLGSPSWIFPMLEEVASRHRIFLLSNTNPIHETAFMRMNREQHDLADIATYFERAYYSHRIGKRKPDLDIFEWVLRENGLHAEETVFIDDSIQHVEGAKKAGIQGIWLEEPMTTRDVLLRNGWLTQRIS